MSTYHLDAANAMNMSIYIETTLESIGKITRKPLWREVTRVSLKSEVKEKGVSIHTRRQMRTDIQDKIASRSWRKKRGIRRQSRTWRMQQRNRIR